MLKSNASNNSKLSAQDVDSYLDDSLEEQEDTQAVPEMEGGMKDKEGLNDEEMAQAENGALTERTLRTVADRIRQMDGRYKGDTMVTL